MIIIFYAIGLFHKIFFLASLLAAQFSLFYVRMSQEIPNRGIGKGKLLGMANYIYFKNNFNLSVMNVTQINFLY